MQPQAKVITNKEQLCRQSLQKPTNNRGGRTVQGHVHRGAGHPPRERERPRGWVQGRLGREAEDELSDKPLDWSVTAALEAAWKGFPNVQCVFGVG